MCPEVCPQIGANQLPRPLIDTWRDRDRNDLRQVDSYDPAAPQLAASWIRSELQRGQTSNDRMVSFAGAAGLGFRVHRRRLLPEKGGAQARLIPSGPSSFYIPVDPTPKAPGWRDQDHPQKVAIERHRTRFLVGHELAHSAFFEQDPDERYPTRRRPYWRGPEEQFCDECSRWILVPPTCVAEMPVVPTSVAAIQATFDVSLEVSARALAAVHDIPMLLLYSDGSNGWSVQWDSTNHREAGASIERRASYWTAPSESILNLSDRNQVVVFCP